MKRISRNKKFFISIIVILAIMLFFNCICSNKNVNALENSYGTYCIGQNNTLVKTQSAYNTSEIIIPDIEASEDFDINNDKLFILDNVNKRIVISNFDGTTIKTIGENENIFLNPQGICVKNNRIYVADKQKEQVIVLDYTNKDVLSLTSVATITYISKPTNPLFGKNSLFVPMKIVVDDAGNIYITSEGNVNGIVHLSNDGEFVGYIGANKTQATLKKFLQSIFFSKEQKERLIKSVPPSPNSIALNDIGLLYTITNKLSSGSVKRYSTTGKEIGSYADIFNNTSAIDIDKNNNVYAIDNDGNITIYDESGYLLFKFAGKDCLNRFGSLNQPVSIKVTNNKEIYVLDKSINAIIKYIPTTFFNIVFQGVEYYRQGLYVEGEEIWNEILSMNSNFILGYRALAQASMKKGNYEEALKLFQMGEFQEGYSEAYWNIRNQWLQNNLITLIIIILSLIALYIILKQIKKHTKVLLKPLAFLKKINNNQVINDLNYAFYYARHPILAIEQMKYKNRLGYLPATILYIVYIFISLLALFCNGYLVTGNVYSVNIGGYILTAILPLFLIVMCNYFVSSVTDGNGKFKHVYIACIYSMFPYMMLNILRIALTNVLTYNEYIILSIIDIIAFMYTASLLYVSVSKIHSYKFKEVIKNVFLTIVAIALVLLFAIILYLLILQQFDFINTFFEELLT